MSGQAAYPAFAGIEERIDAIAMDGSTAPASAAAELLAIGERVLEAWVRARGEAPTDARKEGFRLLALHRQGARGEPSFNACRETCRELVYHYNLIAFEPDHPDTGHRLTLAAMIARHLMLFVGGKLEVAGLGEFCCSARPLRAAGH
ncbi:hypothetical protein [Hyphomicrobium sp. CS1BSMeth3]|uniref:hypothetical protein n=1 Tax=Hyphomicrobium sp. CS1BSMeth3 TaxID=1892844 RepID=UPI000931FDE6|nr:hypothetical protein [Hyphomicrobium sp. CS1BSMeth3]